MSLKMVDIILCLRGKNRKRIVYILLNCKLEICLLNTTKRIVRFLSLDCSHASICSSILGRQEQHTT